jgi:hypothetical protein
MEFKCEIHEMVPFEAFLIPCDTLYALLCAILKLTMHITERCFFFVTTSLDLHLAANERDYWYLLEGFLGLRTIPRDLFVVPTDERNGTCCYSHVVRSTKLVHRHNVFVCTKTGYSGSGRTAVSVLA